MNGLSAESTRVVESVVAHLVETNPADSIACAIEFLQAQRAAVSETGELAAEPQAKDVAPGVGGAVGGAASGAASLVGGGVLKAGGGVLKANTAKFAQPVHTMIFNDIDAWKDGLKGLMHPPTRSISEEIKHNCNGEYWEDFQYVASGTAREKVVLESGSPKMSNGEELVRDKGHEGWTLAHFMRLGNVVAAKLTEPEVIVLRLPGDYLGPGIGRCASGRIWTIGPHVLQCCTKRYSSWPSWETRG